jgi:hypothetical protein
MMIEGIMAGWLDGQKPYKRLSFHSFRLFETHLLRQVSFIFIPA